MRDLLGQLSLVFDRVRDLGAALVKLAQIGQTVKKGTQSNIVKRSGDLLAVTRDKRNGVSFIDQGYRLFNTVSGNVQLLG